jgi:serine protease SohB
MTHLYEYLVFLAEAITVVVAIVVVLSIISSISLRRSHVDTGHLEVNKLNDSLDALKDGVRRAMLAHGEFKKLHRQESKTAKKEAKATNKENKQKRKQEKQARQQRDEKAADPEPADIAKRVFVLDFKGDLSASQVKHLRMEITAILTMAETTDEVVIRLESPGGSVHGYGLAASQLDRVRQHGVRLVVIVDKVAASGGYLMAAVADRVLAAPFAVIGSIGVVAQIPNVHRLLKKHDVDVEVLTAGKYKRTLTVLGENTEEGRQKFIEELEDVHALFQEYVGSRRPGLNLEEIATGEAWYGERALDRKLIDEITTSDEYVFAACQTCDVFHVAWVEHKRPIERLLGQIEGVFTGVVDRLTGHG